MASNLAGLAFIPYYRHIMELLETNRDLKSTAKGIFHQMCYAAAGTAIGGIVAGPVGAMVGGVVGTYAGYRTVHTYESMIAVLQNLSDQEKAELVAKVQDLVGGVGIEALTQFIAQQVNREVLLNLVREFAGHASKGG